MASLFNGEPIIEQVPLQLLREIAYSKKENLPQSYFHGLYDYRHNKIYINEDIDINSIEGQAIIQHELAHRKQYEEDRAKDFECIAAMEAEAYKAEANWRWDNQRGFSRKQYNNLIDFGESLTCDNN